MELLTNDLIINHLAGSTASQALIEGELPLPEGHRAAAILDQSGELTITGVEVIRDKLLLDGTLTAELICTEADGTPFAFRSGTAFHHKVELPGADAGMEGKVLPVLQSLACTPEQDAVRLSAVVDLTCRAESRAPIRTLSGIRDVPDLLMKSEKVGFSRKTQLAESLLRVREEFAASSVREIVSVRSAAAVSALSPASGGVLTEGTLFLSALCRDQDGELFQSSHQFPFSETVSLDAAGVPTEASAEVIACSLRPMGEGSGIFAAEAELKLSFFGYEAAECNVVLDAYAPSTPMECIRKPLTVLSQLSGIKKRISLSESVAVPEGWPAIKRCVYANAHPVITGSTSEDEKLLLDGLIITRLVYQCTDGRLHAFSEDVPFLLNAEFPEGASDGDHTVRCLNVSASGEGTAAEVSYTLLLESVPLGYREILPVTGTAPADAPPPLRGIVLYFAGAGETLWDVAKRFSTTPDALRATNPELSEELHEGERLLLFLNRQN
ncbi:MAG: LysM peptidoglycan-binding domain-containing protein [Clostridia bacterium]|nr:LysM peptidoglycan-binding domain-containing protein [Clostridia bacterium]